MRRFWLLLIFLATGCATSTSQAQQQQETDSLVKTFKTLETLQVQEYRNQDWCKNIAYHHGKFSNTKISTCNLFKGNPKAFDEQASQDFQAVAEAVSRTHVSLYLISDMKYDQQGHLRQAEFHLIDCSCYYVYSPRYKLPPDIPAERLHTIINQDWYFVQQDPM
jgi:putative NIF3 family GTP cyclohydrolase 1 type 2